MHTINYKMFPSNILCCVFVLYFRGIAQAEECGDCTAMRSCDRVQPILENLEIDEKNSLKLIQDVLCGFEDIHPKVCCSKLPELKDEIENHPNVALLPVHCGDIDGNRIIGGTTAKMYEFPWMALISHNKNNKLQFQCGGSVINSRYILTAAHCVDSTKQVVGVRIGEFDISTRHYCEGFDDNYDCESDVQDIGVEKIITHKGFTGRDQDDIALIRLETPVDLSQRNAQPICLPWTKTLRAMAMNGRNVTVAGWGATERELISNKLLKVEMPIVMEGDCLYYDDNIRKIICAGVQGRDSCRGDSGGPLIVESLYKGTFRYIQYGIVSYGPENCGSNEPGVYTDVSKYIPWILDNIEE